MLLYFLKFYKLVTYLKNITLKLFLHLSRWVLPYFSPVIKPCFGLLCVGSCDSHVSFSVQILSLNPKGSCNPFWRIRMFIYRTCTSYCNKVLTPFTFNVSAIQLHSLIRYKICKARCYHCHSGLHKTVIISYLTIQHSEHGLVKNNGR